MRGNVEHNVGSNFSRSLRARCCGELKPLPAIQYAYIYCFMLRQSQIQSCSHEPLIGKLYFFTSSSFTVPGSRGSSCLRNDASRIRRLGFVSFAVPRPHNLITLSNCGPLRVLLVTRTVFSRSHCCTMVLEKSFA